MREIKFDFNNMFSFNVGASDGVRLRELQRLEKKAKKAHAHLQSVIKNPISRINLGLEWAKLPFQDKRIIKVIQEFGLHIAASFENVIFLGIGGSYLGLKAAQDALCPPYYNEFNRERNSRPRIYFEGNNLDPQTLRVLLRNLNPKKTFVIVISKSGETTETKAAFEVVERWLKAGIKAKYGRHILAITDPETGSLRKRVSREQRKDAKSFLSLPLLKGVGGRYSQFNMGLLHLAIIGVEITQVLAGARAMAARCSENCVYRNPAYLYAAVQYILYQKKEKSISILMPFSETLKASADWYAQLLAESLGKKYERKIRVLVEGLEEWEQDRSHIVNVGRTPLICRGTTDLHSIHQNNIEGVNNKTITFIRVEQIRPDIKIGRTKNFLSRRSFCDLLNLAQQATEWSLVKAQRPNCAIILPEITPYFWGQLLFFFQLSTAFEAELLNVNAFDQPGVEGYKNYMSYKLGKPGISAAIKNEIKKKALIKKGKFIL